MQLTEQSRQAWVQFLNNQDNYGHARRVLHGTDIDAHVQACWDSSRSTAKGIKADLPDIKVRRILEIGSSAGLNCYALQQEFPDAEIIGIEPEHQAVNAANAMHSKDQARQPQFEQGFGENLPLPDGTVDLIVCHTVIEHVNDVEAVVREMARVLSLTGAIHLEAPNYRFPYEPHLGVFTIPLFGKKFVKFTALLQGQWSQLNFINHLKFVTPGSLQRLFKKYGFCWDNRAIDKLRAAASGKAVIKKYRLIAKVLGVLQRIGVAPLIIAIIGTLGLYPSVLYTLRKQTHA